MPKAWQIIPRIQVMMIPRRKAPRIFFINSHAVIKVPAIARSALIPVEEKVSG